MAGGLSHIPILVYLGYRSSYSGRPTLPSTTNPSPYATAESPKPNNFLFSLLSLCAVPLLCGCHATAK